MAHTPTDHENVRLPKSVTNEAREMAAKSNRSLGGMITHAWRTFVLWRKHVKPLGLFEAGDEVEDESTTVKKGRKK